MFQTPIDKILFFVRLLIAQLRAAQDDYLFYYYVKDDDVLPDSISLIAFITDPKSIVKRVLVRNDNWHKKKKILVDIHLIILCYMLAMTKPNPYITESLNS